MKCTLSFLAFTTAIFLHPLSIDAAVIGYWRFEDSSNLGVDSSGNNLNLTNTGVASYTLPASGRGSKFFDPIPQTGAANAKAGSFAASEFDRLNVSDPWSAGLGDFTVESLVNVSSVDSSTGIRVIASQWGTSSSNHSWQLGVTGTGSGLGARNLILQLSQTGASSGIVNFDSDFQLTLTNDYYIAASVDFSVTGTSVTFYFQDLTAGGALQTRTVTSSAITSVYNSTSDFIIGRGGTSTGSPMYFDGYIDEVRLSDTALASSQLYAVPEPSTLAVLIAGMLFFGVIKRRKFRRAS